MKPSPNRWKNFFADHRQRFSLAGWFIVFLTFVAKEGYSDRWRDQASAIDLAQLAYSVRAGDSELAERIQNAEDGIEIKLAGPAHGKDNDSDDLTPSAAEKLEGMQFAAGSMRSTSADLQSLADLIEDTPHSAQLSTRVETLKSQVETCLTNLDDMLDKITVYRYGHKSAGRDLDSFMDSADECWLNEFGFRVDADAIHADTVKAGTALRRDLEHKADVAFWISVVTYSIGWALALLGRAFGIPVEGTES